MRSPAAGRRILQEFLVDGCNMRFRFAFRLLICLLVSSALIGASAAQSRRTPGYSPRSAADDDAKIRDRLNRSTVGLDAGLLEGAAIHFDTDIARVVNDGEAVHVLPIVTSGPTENVNDLLYLKG